MTLLAGKRAICTTNLNDFTDIQAVGSDNMFERYESVFSVVQKNIDEKYWSFLSQPVYSAQDDILTWYADNWNETPLNYTELDEDTKGRYSKIRQETIDHYKNAVEQVAVDSRKILKDAIKYIRDEFLFCFDNQVVLVAWGMKPQTDIVTPSGLLTYMGATRKHVIRFQCGEHGRFEDVYAAKTLREENHILTASDLPNVISYDGYRLVGWTPEPIGMKVNQELSFEATYEKIPVLEDENAVETVPKTSDHDEEIRAVSHRVKFVADKHGVIDGNDTLDVEDGTTLTTDVIPTVSAKKGYKFSHWDSNPTECVIDDDKTFIAQFKEKWWKRLWNKKWLRWLLLLLLIFFLLFLFSHLFRGCANGKGNIPTDRPIHIVNPQTGELPDYTVTPPLVGDDGKTPLPIIDNPNAPDIIANRLNIYFEKDDADLNKFARDFKKAYPSDEYKIIGSDNNVKWIQIQIPANERSKIRGELQNKIPEQPFFVVDESVYEIIGAPVRDEVMLGWHLQAINAQRGWQITQGSTSITIAIVDDGCDVKHPSFKGKITKPYNVFTRNNHITQGDGHGTAVASVAAGNWSGIDHGVVGVAPKCNIMPIQVFDHQRATFSSIISGIMYAIHKNADVVNLSIGSSFPGLQILPNPIQDAIARNHYKDEEWVWNKIFKLAKKKNIILVWAAGNDNILACVPPEHRSNSIVTVAAVNKKYMGTDFTNYSRGHCVSAPGVDIPSAFNNASYQSFDGTSFSAPIVSGAVALMKSLNASLTVDDIIAVLQTTGLYIEPAICPMIQLDKALQMIQSGNIPERGFSNNPNVGENVGYNNDSGSDNGDSDFQGGNGNGARGDGKIGNGNGSVNDDNGRAENGDEGSSSNSNVIGSNPPSRPDNTPDYDYIRRLIKEYEEKIKELKKQLPENQGR